MESNNSIEKNDVKKRKRIASLTILVSDSLDNEGDSIDKSIREKRQLEGTWEKKKKLDSSIKVDDKMTSPVRFQNKEDDESESIAKPFRQDVFGVLKFSETAAIARKAREEKKVGSIHQKIVNFKIGQVFAFHGTSEDRKIATQQDGHQWRNNGVKRGRGDNVVHARYIPQFKRSDAIMRMIGHDEDTNTIIIQYYRSTKLSRK